MSTMGIKQQFLGGPSMPPDAEISLRICPEVVAIPAYQKRLPIWIPVFHPVAGCVESDLLWLPAFHRYHIHLPASLSIAHEGDFFAIRGKVRQIIRCRVLRQLLRRAALSRHYPYISAPGKRQSQDKKFVGPQFGQMWRALFSPIGFLLFLAFLVSFGLTNFESIFGLYALERYDYGPQQVGTILTVIGLTSAVVQGGLTGPLTKRWGEVLTIKASLLGSVVGFLIMLSANTFPTVLLTVGFFVLSNAMLRPAVSSLTSKQATTGQGVAMGLNSSFMSLGRIAGPIWAGLILDINLNLPYTSGAVVMLLSFFASLLWLKEEQPQPTDVELQLLSSSHPVE